MFRKAHSNGEDSSGGVLLAIKFEFNPIFVPCNTHFKLSFIDIIYKN